ncbi:ABC transporter substrate-binding protein [Alicyclobacillus tolerans]|uniref:ABC transporter substrate-binding protein n=1 Tax=Alicyclobacillus tolerans TaxID=90970 RepID=UPI001F17F279|nr:ABC transporter substrate-binding protein [Alicyclobacillus tolerans]MCF8565734.1 ABC transporter substrate-binding protein [Alicyclobacillus tolerans]
MFKKVISTLGISAVLVGSLAGCGSSSGSNTAPSNSSSSQNSGQTSSSHTLVVATVSDPSTLDPQATTANITADDMQGVFQWLFTFNSQYKLVPMLAKNYTVSTDGKTYVINLRQNVLFHNMQKMTSADVVASINRWTQVSPIGQSDVKTYGIQVAATGPDTVKITLNKPYAQLLADLSFWYGGAAIYPASVCKQAGTGPLTQFIGTGPYKFVKWVRGQYIEVTKFKHYSQSNLPTSLYSGQVSGNIDTIKYVPVPNPQTRVAGLISGQYDVAESLDPATYQQVASASNVTPEMVKPFGYPIIVFNKAQGIMSNVKVRQAFLAALNMKDLMLAAFGNPNFFDTTPSLYPPQQPQWYSTAGSSLYNQANPQKAKQLLKAAGYNGQPIRWLVSQQYPFLYKAAQAAVPELQQAGFNIKLDVVDWSTLVQERNNPKLYDAFFTYNAFSPEPPIAQAWLSSKWPGFWSNSEKDKLVAELSATTDPAKQKQIWDQIQKLVYTDVPFVDLGQFYNFEAISKKVTGFTPTYSPFFYDSSLN